MATADQFFAIDLRVGTVLEAEHFPEARQPSIKLTIDFGDELGVKRSSAQITTQYSLAQLIGRQVVAVVNIGTRRIAGFTSEVQKLAAKSGQNAHVFVGLSGEVSPRLREELEKRGMIVQDRLVPGPLK